MTLTARDLVLKSAQPRGNQRAARTRHARADSQRMVGSLFLAETVEGRTNS